MTCPTCHKPTPPGSVHTCSPVPLLTAKAMKMLLATSCCNCAAQLVDSISDHEVEALDAMADGRVACYDTQAGVFVGLKSESEWATWARENRIPWRTANGAADALQLLHALGVVKP